MSSFDDRKKSFEKKFAHEEENFFKINAKRNKYLDLSEPGDEGVFIKVKSDLAKAGIENIDDEIRNKMKELMERAKKDFS